MKPENNRSSTFLLIALSAGLMFCSFASGAAGTEDAGSPGAETPKGAASPTGSTAETVAALPAETATAEPEPSRTPAPETPTSLPSPSFGRWTDAGLTGEAVFTIVASPDFEKDSTLFAGGEGKVWTSTDAGVVWDSQSPAEGVVTAMAISPNFAVDRTVFAAFKGGGLYRSVNGGGTWSKVNNNVDILSLAISPAFAADRTVFFGSSAQLNWGAFRSRDGGNTWANVNSGLSNVFVGSLAFSPDYANDRRVWAGTSGFLFESQNGGDSWVRVLGGADCLLGSIRSITVSPDFVSDGTAFAAAGSGLLVHKEKWNCPKKKFSDPILAIALSPEFGADRTLFIGTSREVWVSYNSGSSWADAGGGLEGRGANAFAVGRSADRTIFAATNKGIWKNAW